MHIRSCKINHTFDLHHAAAGMCGVNAPFLQTHLYGKYVQNSRI